MDPHPPTRGPLIAVVDDEESVCRAMERLLRSVGYDVETYASGTAFLASDGRWRASCVVLDFHMPGVSGFDVQVSLAGAGQEVPVVMVTGRDSDEVRERALTAGAAAYLRKPVDGQMLLSTVEEAIAHARRRRL